MSRRQDVFRALEAGYSNEYEIAEYLGCSDVAARHCLRRLCDALLVRVVPSHYALEPKAKCPTDRRGSAPTSRANLLSTNHRKAALIKHGRAGTLKKRAPVIELEKCWPMRVTA